MFTRESCINQVQSHAVFVNAVLDMFNECSAAFSKLNYWQYAEKRADAATVYNGIGYMVNAIVDELCDQVAHGAIEDLADVRNAYRPLFMGRPVVPPVIWDFLDAIDTMESAYEEYEPEPDLSDYLHQLRNLQSMGQYSDIWQDLRDLADEMAAYADAMEEMEESIDMVTNSFVSCYDDLAEWLMSELGYRRQPDIIRAFAEHMLESDHSADYLDFADGI